MTFTFPLCAAVLAVAILLPPSVCAAPRAATPDPAGTTLIRNVTVIAVDTDEVLPRQSVLIRRGRIEKIVPARTRLGVRGARVIDGSGRFLVPGFVDAHVHVANEGALRGSKDARAASLEPGDDHAYDRQILLSFLKAGVTSAANLGGSASSDGHLLWLREEIAAGRMTGPRLFVGKRIDGPRAEVAHPRTQEPPVSQTEAPTRAADGAAAVRAAKARRYDFIKPYQFLNRETYRAVVDTARELRMVTSGHLPELGCAVCADRAFAFAHPLDSIAHAEELARYARESGFSAADIDALADAVATRRIAVTPTLITLKTIVHMYAQREVPPVPAGWDAVVDPVTRRDWAPPGNRYLSEAFRAQQGADTFSAGYDFARVLTRALWKRGVPLSVGTDAALPGLAFGISVQQEMIELREIGLTPVEVLRAASSHPLRLFAPAERGAVREGERADLVLLDADPLADIHNIARIAGVFVRGRWLPVDEIDAELAALAKRNAVLAQPLREAASAEITPR